MSNYHNELEPVYAEVTATCKLRKRVFLNPRLFQQYKTKEELIKAVSKCMTNNWEIVTQDNLTPIDYALSAEFEDSWHDYVNGQYIAGSAKLLHTVNVCHKDIYKVAITTDMNDGDYITEEHWYKDCDIIEFDILLWAYLCKYYGDWNTKDEYNHYGHHVKDNTLLPWLYEYLTEFGYLAFDGQYYGHSISGIKITYYNYNGVERLVELPKIEELFLNEEKFADYMTECYNKMYPNEE